jgi:ABC-2 type transport system permease protein
MVLTIALFLLSYAMVTYLLVGKGLEFVQSVPLLGPMLTERLIYMMFFAFFLMLVVSNATITGMGLFRRNETGWLLTLPLTHRSLVLWKTVEGMVMASWGLLLLSAPILAAVQGAMRADSSFFPATLPALVCLVAISAHFSTWLLLLVVRYMRWSWLRPIALGIGIAVILLTLRSLARWEEIIKPTDVAGSLSQILRHTDLFTHPLLPSSWVAEAVLAAARQQISEVWFYNLLLASWALVSVLVTIRLSSAVFYPAWTRSLLAADTRRARGIVARLDLARWLPVSRVTRSLIVKDIQTFAREPAQWGQTLVIFGLLFLYSSNLRRILFDSQDAFWSIVTSYLNLLVCCLALSTLTTRFLFPQLSAEGRRVWMLSLAPVPLGQMLDVKLWLFSFATGLLTGCLTLISCWSLRVPTERTLLFLATVLLLTLGLNALALALGALFPNFKESNPAKIVSGFGGTLCLILSFIYISGALVMALLPAIAELRPRSSDFLGALPSNKSAVGLAGVVILTLIFGLFPYLVAKKRIKNLDYFRDV